MRTNNYFQERSHNMKNMCQREYHTCKLTTAPGGHRSITKTVAENDDAHGLPTPATDEK